MNEFYNNELHLHTDASVSDGAQTVCESVDAAIACGATAVAITDHGVCTNWIDFYNYCKGSEVNHKIASKQVKPILGVEAYLVEMIFPEGTTLEGKEIRQHLTILAKNYEGFQDISRFVTECNRHMDAKGKPIGNFALVKELLGKGNVIVMSACMAGVLATPLRYNDFIDDEIAKIEKRIQKSYESLPEDIVSIKKSDEAAQKRIDARMSKIDALKPIATKTYRGTKAAIKKMEDKEKAAFLLEQLTLEEIETKEAKARTKDLRQEIAEIKAENGYKENHALYMKHKDKFKKIDAKRADIQALEDAKKTAAEMYADAKEIAQAYVDVFGDDFYAEVQYHGIEAEERVFPQIVQIAKELNLSLVATNDVHFAEKGGHVKRNYLRVAGTMKYGWKDYSDSDKELYYKTGEEKIAALEKILDKEIVVEAMENIKTICDKCNVELSDEKHYPEFEDADNRLRELVETGYTKAFVKDSDVFVEIKAEGIKGRYPDMPQKIVDRYNYELDVISKMGFSSYFLFIADVISVCKNAREHATDIGPARGSGAGSVVCYASGITEIDPIELNLLFERFLNPHRVSMPDIDTDFSKFAREYAINYVTEKYGSRAVTGIMTKAKMGTKNALTYAPKLYAMEQGLDRMYYSDLGSTIRKIVGDENLFEAKDTVMMEMMNDPDVEKIYEIAELIEGYITSYGQHAAGIIAIQKDNVEDFIPLMMAEDDDGNQKLVIQADMVQAEAQLGFIKFDFLGLKNLNVITMAQRMILQKRGIDIDAYKLIPDDEKVYSEIFATGNTNFVFQFESDGMKNMLKKLQPKCFGDIILAVSVYRPGPMDFIPDIIESKNTGKKSAFVERIPMLEDILKDTYGYPVYQEEVMQIMTTAAGFDMGHADNVRRFMSKKKEDKLAAELPAFIEGCVKNGIQRADAEWLFQQLMPFAKYGFNKSHAAAYSFVSYITAYLKYYFEEEYLCSVMLEQSDKTFQLQSDCKRLGIEILPPDVNMSNALFTKEDDKKIRIGLSLIKGFDKAAAEVEKAREEGPFVNLKDFIRRTSLKKNEYENLILAGACDNLVQVADRKAMIVYAEEYNTILSERTEIKTKIALAEEAIKTEADNKKQIAAMNKKTSHEKNLAENIIRDEELRLTNVHETSIITRCEMEFDKLGMFLTGNPLDEYFIDKALPDEDGSVENVAGIITSYKPFKTKNGDNMATFSFTDKDGKTINTVIFPRDFEQYQNKLDNNAVIAITGTLATDEERGTQLIVNEVQNVVREKDIKVIVLPSARVLTRFAAIVERDEEMGDSSIYGLEVLGKRSSKMYRLNNKSIDMVKLLGAQVI